MWESRDSSFDRATETAGVTTATKEYNPRSLLCLSWRDSFSRVSISWSNGTALLGKYGLVEQSQVTVTFLPTQKEEPKCTVSPAGLLVKQRYIKFTCHVLHFILSLKIKCTCNMCWVKTKLVFKIHFGSIFYYCKKHAAGIQERGIYLQ